MGVAVMRFPRVGLLLPLAAAIFGLLVLSACGTPNVERLKQEGDADGLIQALLYEGSEEGRVVPAAYDALREMGAPAVEPLIKVIGDRRERLSSFALRLLGDIKDPRAVDPLVAALADDKLEEAALFQLCRIADMRTIGVMMNYLDQQVVAEGGLVEINVNYVEPVLSGRRVTAAAYHVDEPGPHMVVIADERPFADFRMMHAKGDPENWNALMPPSWQPLGKPESIQLVLCWEGSRQIEVETSRHADDIVGTRVREQRSVALREAATGNVVATAVLEGPQPDKFPEFIGVDQDFTISGGFSKDLLIAWLKPFVEGSGE
jgi:hypothetical protein